MADLIITPSLGKIDFIHQSAQAPRVESIILHEEDGLVFTGKISASSVTAPLNVINVTAGSSNVNYPFIFADSGETGPKSLLMDSAGGTYNPSTNTATIDISGNSATTTLASNSTNLGGVAAASYVTLTGTQTLTNKTITGTFTGNLTGTGSWATNAVNANTATNSTQLNGQAASYYTNIPARLGYTPVNQAGDTISGNLTVNGNFAVNGSITAFSASNIYITSSNLTVTDNILLMNALSPYQRYAGIQMYDSGSGTLSQLLWDGEGDYFFLTGSSVNGKIITGPDSQANLTSNFIPKATAGYKLGNSLIYDNGTSVGIGTTTPAGGFHINNDQGNFSEVLRLQRSGGIFYSIGLDTNFLNIAYNGNTNASNIFVLKTNGFLGLGNLQNANYNLDIASTQGQGIQLRYDTTTNYLARISPYWNSNTDTRIDFAINRVSGTTPAVIMSVGYGENVGIGTTAPVSKLQVNSTTSGATLLRTDGTNGTLFSVVDDLSDSLMSVNNSAGLPVLEVFADDRIVAGQYGQNDFIVKNNKVGIGTNNPVNKLTVSGSTSIGESYINTSAPTNGLIVQGNVGIGTTSTGAKLEVKGIDDASITAIFQSTAGGNVAYNGGIQLGNAASSQNSKIYHNSSGDNTLTFESNYSSGTANKFIFSPGGTERVRFQQNGKVGIGTTVPTSSLHIKPLALGADLLILERYATQAKLIYAYESAADGYLEVRSGADVIISKLSGYASTPSYFQSNVGIGTTSPTTTLHVVGVISGSSFSGAGTGLTGTAANLTAGTANSVAWTNVSSRPTAVSAFTNDSLYQYHRGDITSLSSSATNVVQPLGTFDGANITNAPTSGWYNYLSSTHGNYLTSLIANLHRSADWYVGYKEGPGGTPTNPSWYKLLHSGNYTDYTVTKTGTGASGNWAINAANITAYTINQNLGTGNSPTFAGLISSGNVGIGTTSATARLHVSGSTGGVFEVDTAGGTTNLYVSASGNIGIGTTNPVSKLDVYGPVSLRGTTVLTTNFDLNAGNTNDIYGNIRVLRGASLNDGMFIGYGGAGGPLRFFSNSGTTEFVTIATSGFVGIGSTAPAALLNIRASAPTSTGTVTTGTNILIDSNTSSYITFRNTADNGTYAGLTFLDNNTGGYIIFRNYTGDVATGSDSMIYGTYQDHIFQNGSSETINGKTETMRIKGNGYVGIGTFNPSAKLHVFQSNSGGVAAILLSQDESTIQGPSANTQIRMGSNLVLNASSIIPISTNGSERVRIDSSGNVGIGTSSAGRKLDVEGIVRTRGASGTGGFEIGAASSGAAKWRIEWDSASDSLDFNWVG